MTQREIFVSYAWEGESETIVDQLCGVLSKRGHQIIRDKSHMAYRDSIKQFMDRIGQGKFIIAVVNDKYMRSEYCMYEAYRMFQSPAFRKRVFPIVLPDADIFSFHGQAAYLEFWLERYAELETEYRKIASRAPTMVAPLTERLRDVEATTRFINDFMAEVGDMNVLTAEMHQESGYASLISAIEMRMVEGDAQPASPADPGPASAPVSERSSGVQVGDIRDVRDSEITIAGGDVIKTRLDTGGGTYIGGSVNTGGGDFVAGDKTVSSGPGGVAIGGDAQADTIVTGDENIVGSQRQDVFVGIYRDIQAHAALSAEDRSDLSAEVRELEGELIEADEPDATFLARRLRNIKRLAPDILDVIVAAMASPQGGFGQVARKVAEEMKRSAS